MNECQLTFGEDPQIRELWQAVGLLMVYDDAGRENKFRVFVSGATREIVQAFITQERARSINVQIITDPDELHADVVTQAAGNHAIDVISTCSQLNIGISRLSIQTPEPYKIVYHVAQHRIFRDDSASIMYGNATFDALKSKVTKQTVSFNAVKAYARCKVTSGIVAVSMLEGRGKEWVARGSTETVAAGSSVRLPEKGKWFFAKGEGESEWLIEVTGRAAESDCEISYERVVA